MLWRNIRGEKIYCKKCGAVCAIEYEGENILIGNFNVIEQMELSRNLMKKYDTDKLGHYFHHFAICEKCLHKFRKGILFDKNHVLQRYLSILDEVDDFCREVGQNIFDTISLSPTKKLLSEISPKAFEILKNAKHFGIKKEKMRIAQKYAIELRKDFHIYFEKVIKEDERYEILNNKVLAIEKELECFLKESKEVIKGYWLIDTESGRNLNRYICYDSTVKYPETIITERKFYTGPIEYSKDAILKRINKKKFKNNVDKYVTDDFFNRLPVKLVKSGFFDTLKELQ